MEDLFQTVSEIQISYCPKIPISKRPRILEVKDIYILLMEIFDHNLLLVKEEAVVLFLNRAHRVLGVYKLSCGGMTSTIVDIRLVLSIALKSLSSVIILAHTHPSGNTKPSRTDLEVTYKLKEAARFMDISLLDHLIITAEDFYSFAENGML